MRGIEIIERPAPVCSILSDSNKQAISLTVASIDSELPASVGGLEVLVFKTHLILLSAGMGSGAARSNR